MSRSTDCDTMECREYFSISMQELDRQLSINISKRSKFIYLILLVMTTWSTTVAVNLDTYYPLIFEDISGGNSYFGFSVLLYPEHGKKSSWIQIGAPRANQSFVGKKIIFEPGAVYRCRLSPTQTCKPIMASGKEYKLPQGEEKRDGSWLGAAMDVQPGPFGQLVMCSPRWIHNYSSHYMPGACYWGSAEDDGNFETLLPLCQLEKYSSRYSGKSDLPFYAYGEAGISAHFPLEKHIKEPSKLVIGVPGLLNWRGGFILYEGAPNTNGVLHKGNYSKLLIPSIGVQKFKDSDYIGYQVNSGYFFKKDRLLYVVGAPRAEATKGKVMVVYIVVKSDDQFSINVRRELLGIQCGEYFGSSIAVGDMNGDSFDDLIVGAPFYSNDDVMLTDYDRGRIAVYLSVPIKDSGYPNMKESEQRIGYRIGGRFGSAVVYLGDINSDGIPEIAVGAPYEDNNRGAVYIYSSNSEGHLGNPVQRLAARDSYDLLKGFGISISPHSVDVDGNGCPDIAVGAYLSGHAVIYRGKPVVKWNIRNPEPHPKSITQNATQFSLNSACITYLGKNAPNSLRIQRKLELDFRCNDLDITDEIILKRGVPLCQNFNISLKPNISDLLKPIEVKISYELLRNEEDIKSYVLIKKDEIQGKDYFCPKCPVPTTLPTEILTIPFSVSCGGDALCTADLFVSGELPELKNQQKQGIFPFVSGSLNTLLFKITVSNKDAVDTAYFTRVFIEIGNPGSLSRFLIECSEIPSLPFLNYTRSTEDGNSTELFERLQSTFIECETGDILPGEERNISLELDMTNIRGQSEMVLAVWATTVNNETNPLDNIWKGKVQLKNEADITVFGKGVPEISSIALEGENGNESKISFIHYYEVQKFGFSQVEEVSIELLLPMYIKDERSKEQFKFLTLKDYKGHQGRPCSLSDNMDLDDEIKTHSISNRFASENTSHISRSEVPSNHTLYVNCSSPAITDAHLVECITVSCNLGPFTSSQTMAKVSLKMEIDVQKLKHMMGTRHIIFLRTHGFIKVVDPTNLQQPPNDKPDHATAYSIFVADVPKKKIETWIFAVAIGAGIMIVLFLVMALAKAGFFKRKKKDELKALKRQTLLMISEDFLLQQRLREKSEDREKEDNGECAI